jgi:hypothetical protein
MFLGGPCAWEESGSIVKRLQRMVSKLHEMTNKRVLDLQLAKEWGQTYLLYN